MRTDIGAFQDEFNGERIFLIGNGPSLSKTPLSKLNDEYTMGLNRIDQIYPDTDWRPSFYLAPWGKDVSQMEDIGFIRKHIDMEIPTFVQSDVADLLEKKYCYSFDVFHLRREGIPVHEKSIKEVKDFSIEHMYEYWSENASILLYTYHSMYVAIQLSVYMGFKEIYLLGVDLGMDYQNPHMIFESGIDPYKYNGGKLDYIFDSIKQKNLIQSIVNGISMKVIQKKSASTLAQYLFSPYNKTTDHFISEYITKIKIQDRRIHEGEIIKSLIVAKRICGDKDINIKNATIGGSFEEYERTSLAELV